MKTFYAILAVVAVSLVGLDVSGQEDCTFELICPASIELSCTSSLDPETTGAPEVIVNCDYASPVLTFSDSVEGDECLSVLTRNFVLTHNGVEVASCSQTIVVIDDQAPVFPNIPDDILINCGEELPEAPECPAVDECSGVVSCESFVAQTGSPVDSCVLSLPYGPGPDWSIWLPGLPIENPFFYWDGQGTMVTYFDGSAQITGTVRNYANPALAFELDMWLHNARNWEEWSALGRNYKDDYNLSNGNHEDWVYYEMVDAFSTLTGIDEAQGSVLYLYHMPADYYFGFQCGLGANNHNANEGISGWFTFEGTYNGMDVEGDGDLASDKACENIASPECVSNAGFTYYWRATDACGNVGLASQSVASQDNEAPYFVNFPEDVTLSCSELDNDPQAPLAEDACPGEVSVSGPFDEVVEAECPVAFELHRTWIATDACGNTFSQTQIISVIDELGPSFTDVPELIELSCAPEPGLIFAEATDDCTTPIITFEDVALEEGCPGSVFRTYTVQDACGNSAQATQTILVSDTEAPVFTAFPEDLSVDCGDVPPAENDMIQYSDNCPDVMLEIEEVLTPGTCPGSNSLLRIYTLTDACGNSTTASWTINVNDEIPPVMFGVPQDTELSCGDEIPDALVFATDNCDENPVVSLSATTEELECGYLFIRTWTATDQCGNESSQTQVITVIDDEAPVFVIFPPDLTIECGDAIPESEATAEDECSDFSVEMEETESEDDCVLTITRTFTATDACGNVSTAVQVIQVVDTTAPVFDAFNSNLVLNCDELDAAPQLSAADDCGSVTLNYTDEVTEDDGCSVNIVRTWTATDECGNSTQVSQLITLIDEIAPSFLVFPQDEMVECDDVPVFTGTEVSYSDNCSEPELEIIEEIIPGDCPNNYAIVRTYILTDACGNSVSASLTITVQDTQAPQLLGVPQDITLGCLEDVPDAIVFATDNCSSNLEVSLTATTEELECGYLFIRTWSTSDECGNEISATQTITFVDDTDPVLSFFPEDIYLTCGDPIPPIAEVEVFDECDPDAILIVTDEVEGGPCPQTIVRVFRGADCAGNYTIYAQYIYFEEPPGLAPADQARPDALLTFTNTDGENYQIGLEGSREVMCRVELLDISGRRVKSLAEPMLQSGSRINIDFSTEGLRPGIYLVRVSTAGWNEVRRIIVLR